MSGIYMTVYQTFHGSFTTLLNDVYVTTIQKKNEKNNKHTIKFTAKSLNYTEFLEIGAVQC